MKTYADEPIHPDPNFGNSGTPGLTKREYFASLAMQGLLTKYSLNTPNDQNIVAQLSVELADTLINEFNK